MEIIVMLWFRQHDNYITQHALDVCDSRRGSSQERGVGCYVLHYAKVKNLYIENTPRLVLT